MDGAPGQKRPAHASNPARPVRSQRLSTAAPASRIRCRPGLSLPSGSPCPMAHPQSVIETSLVAEGRARASRRMQLAIVSIGEVCLRRPIVKGPCKEPFRFRSPMNVRTFFCCDLGIFFLISACVRPFVPASASAFMISELSHSRLGRFDILCVIRFMTRLYTTNN